MSQRSRRSSQQSSPRASAPAAPSVGPGAERPEGWVVVVAMLIGFGLGYLFTAIVGVLFKVVPIQVFHDTALGAGLGAAVVSGALVALTWVKRVLPLPFTLAGIGGSLLWFVTTGLSWS